MVWNIIKFKQLFSVTFDQFKAELLNKSNAFFVKHTYPKLLNSSVSQFPEKT